MQRNILILAANPTDTPRMRLDQEVREIGNGLERARIREKFTLKSVWATRHVEVRRAMLDLQPSIVHFCGHGTSEGIYLEDDQGQANLVETDSLADFFSLFADTLECVILNACYSESQAEAIAEHIPYVIGMKSAIVDTAAVEFAVAFYDAIGAGKSYEFAYSVACNALQWNKLADPQIPVLIKGKKQPSSIGSDSSSRGQIPSGLQLFKSYRQLVGRETVLSDAIMALSDPVGKWIVGIDGMGGVGKTAIAIELAEKCLRSSLFDSVVWMQSSNISPGMLRSEKDLLHGLSYDSILDTIGWQLGYPVDKGEDLSAREKQVQSMLEGRKVLVILDNMETAAEPQDQIAEHLRCMLDPSKLLMTSRHRFKGYVYAIHLSGLSEEEAIELLLQEAEERGIRRVRDANPNDLREIAQTVGGSPLALKLIAGQLGHLPLRAVLKQMKEVRFSQILAGDEYALLYKHIFFPSWQLLSNGSKKLLIAMAHLVPDTGGTLEAISYIGDCSVTMTLQYINELWSLSFIEVSDSSTLNEIVYYPHPLTQYFVLSDVVGVL